MKHQLNDYGRTIFSILVFFVALIIVGVLLYGTYQWQHNKAVDLQRQVNQLKTQLSEVHKQDSSSQNNTATYTYTSTKGTKIKVFVPAEGSKITSPVAIVGEVPGNWSFEASFPVILKRIDGTIVAKDQAQVLGDWMTGKLVPFSLKLTYASVESGRGTLVLQKDNPSGLAENDDSVTIPITF